MAANPVPTDEPRDRPPLPEAKKTRIRALADEIGETPDEPGKDNSYLRAGELLDATVEYYHGLEVEKLSVKGLAGQLPGVSARDIVQGRIKKTLDVLAARAVPPPVVEPPAPPPVDNQPPPPS